MKKFWVAVLGLTLLACTRQESSSVQRPFVELFRVSGKVAEFSVEIADSPEEQMRGLMQRTELAPESGMLFIFSHERLLSFWMKNTLIPLDILFFDSDGRFVSATTMEPCLSDPCPFSVSSAPALYALEVNAGTLATLPSTDGIEMRLEE